MCEWMMAKSPAWHRMTRFPFTGAFMKRLAAILSSVLAASPVLADVVRLDELGVEHVQQGWGKPAANRTVDGNPLTIAGKTFEHGLGTHADSYLSIDVNGATRFTAVVGADDETDRPGSVEFIVIGDNEVLYRSGVLRKGDAGKAVDLPLAGVKQLTLQVAGGADGIDFDHANWADATFIYTGTAPKTTARVVAAPVILTPKPSPKPRINGATLHGARPGSPIQIYVPVTGERPLDISIENLPAGLSFDPKTRLITGAIDAAGDHHFTVRAKNAKGESLRHWDLLIGERSLSLTPPMGWNSWNVWGMAIDDAKVRAAADAFVSSGLIDHGWTYINIDDGWARSGEDPKRVIKDENMSGKTRDDAGNIRVNDKFPDMKALADYVHAQGLKIGIYSSPGDWTCGHVAGSLGFEKQDARTYADWGIDYLKYDWCSYGGEFAKLRKDRRDSSERPDHIAPYRLMANHLREQKRDIVYSLCQYGMDRVWEWGDKVDGQLWRTTGDITDTWGSMSGIGFDQDKSAPFAKPGNWNDPDMLVVGHVGWGPNVRPTRLTPDEQYTHMTLWSLLSSPLLIGCDLTRLDEFTLSLLTNDEVIEINQDALGKQATKVAGSDLHPVYLKHLADGSVAVGLFNRDEVVATVEVYLHELGLNGTYKVRDVWSQKGKEPATQAINETIPPHGTIFLRLTQAK